MSLDKDISRLERNLQVSFQNKRVLHQALVHRSYLNEHPTFELGHNERLEFLGDAVLELIVTEYLYAKYDNPEGELTNWRASLVNAKMLSEVSSELGVNEYLYLSKGEASDTNSKARQYILADAFEAITGAMYLDQGWDAAKAFIHRVILSKLTYILEHKLYMDPKSRFQEEAQERIGKTPRYDVLSESGPDHAKEFVIGVFVNGDKIAEGRGTSKQEAQVDAAQNALDAKGW